MNLAKATKRLIRRAGIEVTRYPGPNTLPWGLRQVTKFRTIDGVIDVGAHWGEFAQTVRHVVGFDGPIESFEPSSDSFARLAATMGSDPRWTGHHLALGSEAATLDLNIYPSTDFNSFRQAATPGALGTATTERVSVERLDEVCTLTGQLLLKTDTQGFDLEVLRGATGLLDRVEAVAIEVAVSNFYKDAPELVGIIQHLDGVGFELAGLYPLVMNRADRLRVMEFDGVFVRR